MPQVCDILFLSETLSCDRLHITCQDVRHASWGNSECGLHWKCESSVKVCVTHLRMRISEFVLFLEWLSCEIGMQRWCISGFKIADYAQAVFGSRLISPSASGFV